MEERPEFDETTIQVYRARVTNPTADGKHIADMIKVSIDELEAAQNTLEALRLLQPSSVGGWVAVSPETASDILLADTERAILEKQALVTGMRARLNSLSGDYLEARSLRTRQDRVEVVEGIDGIRAVIDDLARTCVTSLDAMVPGGGQSEQALNAAKSLDLAILARGVAIRTLFQHTAQNHRATVDYTKDIVAAGAQVRTTSILPSRLLIYDSNTAVLPLDPERTSAGVVIVRDSAILGLLNLLFMQYWERAVEFGHHSRHETPGPTDLELTVLRLLAAGKKDEIIARQIGMSPRSTSRVIAGIMKRLNASSRFQAGIRAAMNGWLP